ncbi:MAG TPA: RNA polymerase sigma factor [Spirochaetia bacterium]|nr:RNA polymerase sigma factor [Spirochaetia bacterium]
MNGVSEPTVDTETLLIREALTGDRDAFSRLMLQYAQRIYRGVCFIVRNIDDAKDITQETFLRAYRGLGSFDPSKPFYPWIHRIARNLSLNYIGRAERKNLSLPEGDPFPARTEDPALSIIHEAESESLYRAIDRLTPEHREIIMLKHFGECSYAEIAEIVGIPIGTVMSRLYNARMKLKSLLSEENAR